MSELCPVCQSPLQPTDKSCPVCGFKLLGSTQSFSPIPMGKNEKAVKPKTSHKADLRVVRGPQTGVVYELLGDELTIGRNPQCSIFLNDMTVSRKHATLTNTNSTYVINDENSFNGVWVNNQNVHTKTLASGDYIQIGAFCFIFEESTE